jgi:hypothetical protein
MLSWTELKQLCLYLYSAKHYFNSETDTKNKLRGFGPQANYIDRATAACRRS